MIVLLKILSEDVSKCLILETTGTNVKLNTVGYLTSSKGQTKIYECGIHSFINVIFII